MLRIKQFDRYPLHVAIDRVTGYSAFLFCALAFPALYIVSRYNYNLFHGLADIFTIVIASTVFVVAWNSRQSIDNNYLLYAGIAFLPFAFLDLFHVLGNKDMGVFPQYGNLGPALYIASRYVLSISLVIAPLFINRKLRVAPVFAAYSLVTLLVLLSVFYWHNFPACFVEGVGLTAFKVVSDYIICLILLGALALLFLNRRSFDARVLRLLAASILLSIATGLAFTLYADPFGVMNAIGHFFQIISFYLVYLAVIETGLTKPQNILFRKLKQSEEKYRNLFENIEEMVTVYEVERDDGGRIVEHRLRDANHAFLRAVGVSSVNEIRGKTSSQIFGKVWSELHLPAVQKAMDTGQVQVQEIHRPESSRHYITSIVRLDKDTYLGTGWDITDRKRAEEILQKNKERFEILSETASQLLLTHEPQKIVNELCQKVMTFLDCHAFFNYLVDEARGCLHLNAYAGIPEETSKEIEWLDYGTAVCGCAARDACRIVAEDIPNTPDPRTELIKSFGIKAYAAHPLISAGRVMGTLSFGTRSRATFTEEELSLMKTVADRVTIAMERIRLINALRRSRDELEMRVQERTEELRAINEALKVENEERLKAEIELRESENRLRELSTALLSAQERERKLIAGEIHDSLGASLAATKFKVENALNEMGAGNPQTKAALGSVIPIIQGTIEEARRIQQSLRPSMLDDLGILAAINWFCRQFETTYSNIHIEKEIDLQEDEVPESLKIVIYRVLQEALNNVAKHSKASVVLLSLRKADQAMQLVVRDSGQGFDPEKAFSRKGTAKGLGLDSMRERAELSGGFFSIKSSKGAGTVIRATWPLNG